LLTVFALDLLRPHCSWLKRNKHKAALKR